MWRMPDSIQSYAAPESSRAGFSHGLLEFRTDGGVKMLLRQ
jgi:hypothetical protein